MTNMKTTNTKTPGTLKVGALGDIHLGHRRTPTQLIINNLDRLLNVGYLKTLDLLILEGDVFDRQLSYSDPQTHLINAWITRLLINCQTYNVKLRVLEGTKSHDRSQSQFFVEQKNNLGLDVDLHYATNIEIEYIKDFDAYVLYVPDNMLSGPSECYQAVLDRMHELSIDQVDLAVMHGAFDYQLPPIQSDVTHNADNYKKLVKHYIFIGHVHQMSVNGNILAAGSFDRGNHGDEKPKGMFDVVIRNNGNDLITFIENKHAKVYKTVNCHGLNHQELHDRLISLMEKYPKGSNFKLLGYPVDIVCVEYDKIKFNYPKYEWELERSVEKDKKSKTTLSDALKAFTPKTLREINAHTLPELIIPELERFTSDAKQLHNCLDRLNELLKGV